MSVLRPRLNTTLLMAFALTTTALSNGCSMSESDPTKQTIPTDSTQWQKKLGDTFEQLPEDDRGLLSRYMLRMKLSDAYESGAMPRITIKQALVQQREYERLHPNNPTGEKTPTVINQHTGAVNARVYPVTLLPVKINDNDSLSQVKLQFMLSNHGSVAIKSFKGSLLMQDARLAKDKRFNVPLTNFSTPIEPEQSGNIIIESSIENVNVVQVIKDIQGVTITINEGTMTLINGQKVEFVNALVK